MAECGSRQGEAGVVNWIFSRPPGVIQTKANEVVRHLTQFHGRDFKMELVFGIPVINVLWNIVAGRRFEREDVRVKTVMEALRCDITNYNSS